MDCCGTGNHPPPGAAVGRPAGGRPLAAQTASADAADLLVRDVEVVTVTDTSVVITWFTGRRARGPLRPAAARRRPTRTVLGDPDPSTGLPVPGTLKTVLHDTAPTAYHYARRPGSNPAARTPSWPGRGHRRDADLAAVPGRASADRRTSPAPSAP